ncbi:hypothetical protein Tco_0489507 [Tanacetum coccineum]
MVKGKLTDSIFNEMLEFFQNVFPISKGYKLPPSYYAIKKTFKMIGLGYESIHACEHDCCLFRGKENKDLDFGPVCNTSRWKDSNTPGKKVPKKVLHYFLIIPRLQHLYKSSHTAKEMIWHATGKCTEPKPRNVRLGLAADGFNPFGNLSQAYSMWPVILTTYNLPPWLCMKERSFMLTLLIPGPKSLCKDIDVYLRPLIEDLKTINDFPARSNLSGWSGQGYKECPTCNKDTPSVCVLSKTTYVGHRRFLKKPHKWRSSLEFNGQTDNRDPPKEFGRDEILAQLDKLPTRVKGKHPSYGGVKIKQKKYRKKFFQFIKGVKLPDGFRSCFKHKVTDNNSNITGLKSHDCPIMMQHLLPYGLQQYFPDKIAKPIIELCSLFKQICSATLMEDDMLKAQIKVVDILCDLELIYPPALFDIMIHLVIHLPLEALEGGPIRPCLFPNKDMKEEFPDWLGAIRQRHVDNDKDPEVSTTRELFALACGPTWTPISVNSCVVNGVDAPPDIIDVPDEDDYIIDDEDALPHDLADSDDEDLINVDDDGVDKMSADVVRSHGGDPPVAGVASLTEAKANESPIWATRQRSSYIEEVIRSVPLYYPSWLKVLKEQKAVLIIEIGTQFDLRPHMESPHWTEIDAGIKQHLQKAYNTNKAAFKAQHWRIDPQTRTYNMEKIKRARPEAITAEEWDKYIQFWNDPRNIARAAQNRQNRAKSTVISRQGSRSLARLRDEMRQSSATQEYPSLIDTFFVAHTVNGVFTRDEDRLIYEEMRRLEATGTYTDDEINRLARRGKQRGHIPGVGRVLPARATASPKFESGGASGSGGCGDDEESADDQEDEDGDGDGDS